jgi:hypothetical protein
MTSEKHKGEKGEKRKRKFMDIRVTLFEITTMINIL